MSEFLEKVHLTGPLLIPLVNMIVSCLISLHNFLLATKSPGLVHYTLYHFPDKPSVFTE
uniref:Uncharacterized protein n=1 Tax=Anguilla anguilla TaxID=7936 RepID=A0A0E9WVY3_ANGAN